MTSAPSSSRRAKWVVRGLVAAAVLVAWGLLLEFDVPIMRWVARTVPRNPGGWSEQLLLGFRDFGQILPVIVTCVIVAAFDKRWKRIVAAILLAQLLAMGIYNAGKVTVVRFRPNVVVGELRRPTAVPVNSWAGYSIDNFSDRSQSFPSGHSAAAFALGVVLAASYPRLAWLFWTLAIGCAASRFIQLFHWPSDCLAGAVIGYLCGRLVLWLFGPPPQTHACRAAQPGDRHGGEAAAGPR